MKQINKYINEKLRLSAKPQYTCQPKSKDELREIIIDRIKNEGPTCDLNDIDVSKITYMAGLFDAVYKKIFKDFNGNISLWNVSNVIDMRWMFYGCGNFNGDISMWDVSNVENMNQMFYKCTKFNCDISSWDVSKVEYMNQMFDGCKKFNQDLNKWNVSNVENMRYAFENCPTTPKWYDKDKYEK